ncbi:hypothetical protein M427DRAFT_61279, partial [Gonapodya prolifera JEL478]
PEKTSSEKRLSSEKVEDEEEDGEEEEAGDNYHDGVPKIPKDVARYIFTEAKEVGAYDSGDDIDNSGAEDAITVHAKKNIQHADSESSDEDEKSRHQAHHPRRGPGRPATAANVPRSKSLGARNKRKKGTDDEGSGRKLRTRK